MRDPESLPSRPHGVYIHPLSNVNNQFHVGIIIIICAPRNLRFYVSLSCPRSTIEKAQVEAMISSYAFDVKYHFPYLDILISHSYIVCICLQIFRRGHHGELNRPLVSKHFVGPFSYRSNFFDRCDSIISDENLRSKYFVSV